MKGVQRMVEKLKPCPFCGKEVLITNGCDGEGFAEFLIEHYCELDGIGIDISLHDSNVNIITRAWNHRTPIT